MRIEHIAIWTDDLARLAAFYATYFGASVGPKYTNPVKGFASRFVTFGDGGARLELMQSSTLVLPRGERGAEQSGLTHFAVSVGSEDAVRALTGRLRADSHVVVGEPRRTGDGYFESVVLDPDGNRVEITV